MQSAKCKSQNGILHFALCILHFAVFSSPHPPPLRLAEERDTRIPWEGSWYRTTAHPGEAKMRRVILALRTAAGML
jgi:hypothetical protein